MGNAVRFLLNKIGGALLLLTLLTACGSKSSTSELTKELQTVTSWAATAEMTGDAWIRGNVPTVYAKQTLSTTLEKLHKETEKIAHSSSDPTQRRTILDHLQRLESTVDQMSRAVEQKDRTATTQKLRQLSTQKQTISTFATVADGQP